MVAKSSIADKMTRGKFIQSFSKSHTNPAVFTLDTLLSVHDRVVISHQDGSSWAIAIGTITCSNNNNDGVEVHVSVDKALPTHSNLLYRIDQAPSFSRGSVPSTLADLCASDSERYTFEYLSVF